MFEFSFSEFRFIDVVDILLVAFLLYQVYKLLRGTTAIRIMYGLIAVFLVWRLVTFLDMKLLSAIFGAFISVGIIALIIVFQPEIRRFLVKVGTANFFKQVYLSKLIKRKPTNILEEEELNEIITSCQTISKTKTGGLIIIRQTNELEDYIDTGILMDALISSSLLISIFFKSNPLHDGAVIIKEGRIAASSCILPISKQQDIAQRFGLRHRAGLGLSELTDAIAIIISEETGSIEIAKDGILYHDLSIHELRTFFAFDFSDNQEELPHLILAKRLFTRKQKNHHNDQ